MRTKQQSGSPGVQGINFSIFAADAMNRTDTARRALLEDKAALNAEPQPSSTSTRTCRFRRRSAADVRKCMIDETAMMDDFASSDIEIGEARIHARWAGSGRAVLLLHGFPQTHLMWRAVAPLLTEHFTVVCADLRGYGRSSCPPSAPDHMPYSKRVMARDMVLMMEHLGFRQFAVAGHDRGGRVAYRLALDYPDRVARLAVLDILPTETVWARADDRFALAYWPWSLLAQSEPLPERFLAGAPEIVIDQALSAWGTPLAAFPDEVRRAYVEALREPAHIQAICEEYRAAASVDREHDRHDREERRRILCPVLSLWSRTGPLHQWYADEGGPLALWREWGDDVRGKALDAGHFFPEEAPEQTADVMTRFFAGSV